MVHITNYKHKYNKYKQKYLNLLHGGADEIHIKHSKDLKELTEIPFLVANDFIDGAIMGTQFVSLLDEKDKLQLQQVIGKVRDKSALRRELRQVHKAGMSEQSKDKENINNELLKKLIRRRNELKAEIAHIDASNNSANKEIFDLLITFFITQFCIIISGVYYSIVSFVLIGGQGIVFRIRTKGIEGMSNHIIKFAVHDNCDEILDEATALDTYYKDNGTPTTFTPYKSLRHGRTGSLCFSVYDDVGSEDLCVFANAIKQLIITKVESMGVDSSDRGELHDRIMMIPYILIQILLQLQYYKKYRHNDIRFENVVIDIRHTPPSTHSPLLYQGTVLSLLRVTIIDFGKFYPPEHIEYSQIYITSPETLESYFDAPNGLIEGKIYDNQNSDLVGFMWIVIDLLIGKRCGTFVIDELIRIVLSNEQNLLSIIPEEYERYKKSGNLSENWKKRLLLFIYESIMYNFAKDKYTVRFRALRILNADFKHKNKASLYSLKSF
jgi:hypothetical protein